MDERKMFEAWSRSQPGGGFALDRYTDPECTEYIHYATEWTWQAWQAASAGRQELVEALRGLLNTWNAVCDVKGWDRDHTVAAELARVALAKHGEQQ
jgi:hypothetical protein